jgi:LMBR1 domain-containing protein 1
VGWFFFTFFVGVGLMALPMDLLAEYKTRPKPMSTKQYFEERNILGERASKLLKVAERIRDLEVKGESRSRRQKTDDSRSIKKLEKHYYLLKKDLDLLETAHKLRGGNPLWWIGKLVFGVVAIILSVTWIVHIAIFVLPQRPYYTFLNRFFIILEEAFGKGQFSLLGVLAFAIYSFYLLACAIKGNFKLGIRFLFWKVYPMEINNTLMNAFLVNTWILLLVSVPTVQFCAFSFPIYARYTAVDMLFGTQIKYLDFFRYFWVNDVFVWAMLSITFLSTVYLSVFPRDVGKKVNEEIEAIARGDRDND